jgi:hypothetical protein
MYFFDLTPRPPPDFFITPCAIVVMVGGVEHVGSDFDLIFF